MPNKLLHRSIDAVDRRLVLLAPPEAPIPASFENVEVNASRHAKLVTDIQRLRGRIYLQDGAVEPLVNHFYALLNTRSRSLCPPLVTCAPLMPRLMIRTRALSIVRRPATTRSAVAVASPARTS